MADSLRLLLIEDNEDDALLLVAALENGGFDVDLTRIVSEDSLVSALEDPAWDLIISDYHLPGYNGLAALKRINESGRNIPFILVSGAVGEEFIVEAMRAGACDFISKDRLIRLAPVVKRELEEHRIRSAGKIAAEALRESEKRFRMLADNMSQFAWIGQEDGRITWFNKQWLDYTGFSVEDFGREKWRRVVHPDHLERVEASFTRSMRTGSVWDDTFPIMGRNGSYRWFLNRAVPIRNDEGVIASWFGTGTDITELRLKEQELTEAKDAAEAANRAKSEFLAHMSHELRTPISGILGMVDVLDTRNRDTDRHKHLSLIRESAEALLSIIGDILDLSRIEAGIIEKNVVECDLRKELESVIAPFRYMADTQKISLSLEVDDSIPRFVRLDAEKLTQVVRNLISNGVKYTIAGSVSVHVTSEAGTGGEGRLLFSVRDTGIGIPKDKLDSIFESFVRLRKSVTERNVSGTGLGLTVSRKLVEFLGGKLSVESEPGRGSTFSFSVGYEIAERPSGNPPVVPASLLSEIPPLSILLAEDNRINQLFLEISLKEAGHRVTVVGNGKEAYEAVRRGENFDLVLMDIQMPIMDGIEATRYIRQIPDVPGTLPIIALTAFAMKGDGDKFLTAGMNGHVTKPIDWEDLAAEIQKVMRFSENR